MVDDSKNTIARIQSSIQIARSGCKELYDIKLRAIYLERLLGSLRKYSDLITSALSDELGRASYDSYICELIPLKRCLKYLKRNLRSLTKERSAKGDWFTFPAKFSVVQEPYGVVFVHSSWNYPFLLSLEPVAGAVAAGNRVVLQLPVRVPRCASLVQKIIEEVFQTDEVICVRDELTPAETVRLGCDYVFYTGSKAGAVDIMKAAAERAVPGTLELGGKNPCIVDADANLTVAAKKIVWGKFTNSGQTCIAPDYLLVHKSIKSKFLNALSEQIKKMYGEFPLDDSQCGKVVDSFAYERLNGMSNRGRLVCGGEKDPAEKRITPTVLDQLEEDDPLLTEEVFGPLIGVVEFEKTQDILNILRRNPDPLAVYYFGSGKKTADILKRYVRSGSFCINDCLVQFANNHVPFGGAGTSGYGSYHGVRTFSTFSRSRTVMRQSRWFDSGFRYKGGKLKEKLVKFFFNH